MELRERILQEARQEFFRYGVRNVTMDGIATELGISKRTVYETFKDKTELIQTCLKELSLEHERKNREVIQTSSNVIDAIFTFMQEGIKAMSSIKPVFFFDMKKFYPEIWGPMQKSNIENAYNLTHKLLRKGVNEGLFRKEINIRIVSKLFHEQMNLISNSTVFPPDEFDFSEVFQNLVINFMRGISTQKGIELIDQILEKEAKTENERD